MDIGGLGDMLCESNANATHSQFHPMSSARGFFNGRIMFAVHAWAGFQLGILLWVVFATGTLAVVSHELDWLTRDALRVDPRGNSYDFPAMFDGLREAFPLGRTEFVERPEAPGFAAVARIVHPELGLRRAFVDPYTGEVLGHAHWYASFQRFLRDFHRYLLLPNYLGIYVVGATAFLLLAQLVSSFWVYPSWWRGFFTFRRRRSGRERFWKELHKLTGVWAFAFMLIMTVTGIWYVVEFTTGLAGYGSVFQFDRPQLSEARLEGLAPGARRIDAGEAVRVARETLPGLDIGFVSAPDNPREPYYITGQTGALLVRDRASHVFIDSYSGEVMRIQRAGGLGPVRRWVDTADPLHFGGFAWLWSKFPYFAFGMGLTILAATGVWLRWRRIQRMYERGPGKAQEAQRARMGAWKWATLAVLALSALTGGYQIARLAPPGTEITHSKNGVIDSPSGPIAAALVTAREAWSLAVLEPRYLDPRVHELRSLACPEQTLRLTPGADRGLLRIEGEPEALRACLSVNAGDAGSSSLGLRLVASE